MSRYEKPSFSSMDIRPGLLREEFEANVDPTTDSGEQMFEQFEEVARRTTFAYSARNWLREVHTEEDFFQLSFVKNSLAWPGYHIPVSASYPDLQGAQSDHISPYHAELARTRVYHKQQFQEIEETIGLPACFVSHLVGDNSKAVTREEADRQTRDVYTARALVYTYYEDSHVAESVDFEELQKRIRIATDPDVLRLVAEYVPGYFYARNRPLNLLNKIVKYAKSHPEDFLPAIALWEQRVGDAAEQGLVKVNMRHVRHSMPFDDNDNFIWRGQKIEFTHPYFKEQVAVMNQIRDPKNVKELLTHLSLGQLLHSETTVQQLELYQDMMLSDPVVGKTKLINAVVDLFNNLLEYSEDKSPRAAKLKALIEARRKNQGLDFSFFIKFANLIRSDMQPQVEQAAEAAAALTEEGEAQIATNTDLPILAEGQLADLPAAFDRLTTWVRNGVDPEEVDDLTEDILDGMSHAISLTASIGVDRKINEEVITLGSLVLRYPNASAEMIRDMAEDLQRGGSEATVHETYRQLRRMHRNRTRFVKWAPGKGLLS